MENAAKALYIAGAMILVVLLLSLFVYMTTKIGSVVSKFYSKLDDHNISEFNQKFLNYDRKEIDIHETVSLINMVKDSNKKNKVGAEITIYFCNDDWTDKSEDDIRKLLEKSSNQNKKYQCEVEMETNGKLVSEIKIKE